MTEKMKLYGMGLGRSFRTLWAAEETGVDFEYIKLEFAGTHELGNQGEEYKKLNPQGKVPTLIDGKLVVTESGAIVNYLATQVPALNLIPKDCTPERAKYDEMSFFILTDLEQPLWTTGKHRAFLPEKYRMAEQLADSLAYEFDKSQTALITLKGDSPYAAGDLFTMADILLCQTLGWALRFKFTVDSGLLDYKARIEQRPSYQRALDKAMA